jgi:hypothetical protein
MQRAAIRWIVAMLVTAACGSSPAVGPAASPSPANVVTNVSGTIERGPAQTCPSGEPCDPNIVAYRLVFSAPGRPDVTVRVGGDGSFALHLEPGTYSIAAEPPSMLGRLEPSEVKVPKVGTVYLELRFVVF